MRNLILALLLCLFTTNAYAEFTERGAFSTEASVAFGSLTTSFAVCLNNSKPLRIVDVLNDTDQDIAISFDGGTTRHVTIPAYSSFSYDLGAAKLHATLAIWVKYLGAVAPTLGSVYCAGVYQDSPN